MALVRNDSGEDTTVGKLSCSARPGILGDVQHEQSWARIQVKLAMVQLIDLFSSGDRSPASTASRTCSCCLPEAVVHTATPGNKALFYLIENLLFQSVELDEGGTALLEARFIPLNDPTLNIQWLVAL